MPLLSKHPHGAAREASLSVSTWLYSGILLANNQGNSTRVIVPLLHHCHLEHFLFSHLSHNFSLFFFVVVALCFLVFVFLPFLGLLPRHMEVSRLGVESEL